VNNQSTNDDQILNEPDMTPQIRAKKDKCILVVTVDGDKLRCKKAFFLIATSAATSPVAAGCASLKFCGVFFALNVQWNGSANAGRCRLPLREAELGRATYQVRWLLNDFEFDLRDATFGHS
jgi:hypothetical protein